MKIGNKIKALRKTRVDGHPELVSGSVRGEGQEKARGEMLKQVQHDEMIISMRRGK